MNFESFVLAAVTGDLDDEPAARARADAVEFRLDVADDPLDQLDAYDGALPIIATNRVEWEGGRAPDDARRLDALRTAVEHPLVEAIDVELRAVEAGDGPGSDALDGQPDPRRRSGDADRLVAFARERGVSVIVSVHDFEATPPETELDDLLARATDRGDVGKLAVTATEPGDVLPLLAATRRRATDAPVATMAMGAAGRHSRAVAPLYGSRIGYAPVDPAAATAPGQFDLQTLAHLIETLRGD